MAKYNLTEKKEKPAAYRFRINPNIIDVIYEGILHAMNADKKYRDCNYTAKQLADELHTNTRYISAAVNLRFGMNYSDLVNSYRLREAKSMLTDRRWADQNIDQIAKACGFRSRQTLYSSFYKMHQQTPREFQREFFAKANIDAKKHKKKA